MTVRESKETVRAMRLNDNPAGPRYEDIQKLKDDNWQLVLKAFRAKCYPTIEGSDASDLPTEFNAGDSIITGVEQAIAWATKPNIKP